MEMYHVFAGSEYYPLKGIGDYKGLMSKLEVLNFLLVNSYDWQNF